MSKAVIKNAVDYFLDGQTPIYEVAIALGIKGDTTDERIEAIAQEREQIETLDENKNRIYWEPRSYASLCQQIRKHVRSQERSWINILGTWVKLVERDHDVEIKDRIRHVKRFGHWDRMVEHFGYEKARGILEAIEPMTEAEKRKARIVFLLASSSRLGAAYSQDIITKIIELSNAGTDADRILEALQGIENESNNTSN